MNDVSEGSLKFLRPIIKICVPFKIDVPYSKLPASHVCVFYHAVTTHGLVFQLLSIHSIRKNHFLCTCLSVNFLYIHFLFRSYLLIKGYMLFFDSETLSQYLMLFVTYTCMLNFYHHLSFNMDNWCAQKYFLQRFSLSFLLLASKGKSSKHWPNARNLIH